MRRLEKRHVRQLRKGKDGWREGWTDVLCEVAELAEDADEAGHGDAIEDGLGVVLVRPLVEVAAPEGVLVGDRVPRQRHCPRQRFLLCSCCSGSFSV